MPNDTAIAAMLSCSPMFRSATVPSAGRSGRPSRSLGAAQVDHERYVAAAAHLAPAGGSSLSLRVVQAELVEAVDERLVVVGGVAIEEVDRQVQVDVAGPRVGVEVLGRFGIVAAGQTIPNLVTVQIGASGQVSFATEVVGDVGGYFAST